MRIRKIALDKVNNLQRARRGRFGGGKLGLGLGLGENGGKGVAGKQRDDAAASRHLRHHWIEDGHDHIAQNLGAPFLLGAILKSAHQRFGQGGKARNIDKQDNGAHVACAPIVGKLFVDDGWNQAADGSEMHSIRPELSPKRI